MSRIVVTGVVIASTALGAGFAVRMGALKFFAPEKKAQVTTIHVDLATFTAQTNGSGHRGRIPVNVILRLPGLRAAQDVCRTAQSLRKVILRDLYRNSIPLEQDSTLKLAKTTSRLLKVTNGFMGSNVVSDVIVIDRSVEAKADNQEFINLLNCRKVLALPGTKGKRHGR